ncbi:MAG: LEA type 2 family protein [Bacteroidota bacterium]
MKNYFFILIAFCLTLLSSCGTFQEVTFNGIEKANIVSLSQKGAEALITVRIKNPNKVSFNIYKSEMDVTISGINAGKAYITENVKIKGRSEESYTFKVKSDFTKLSLSDMPKLLSIAMSKNVKIGIKGTLKGGKLFIKRSYPIDIIENVPLDNMPISF